MENFDQRALRKMASPSLESPNHARAEKAGHQQCHLNGFHGFFHVFSTTVCTDMHQNHHQNHPVTTLSDHPVTSFQSSRCAVVVAMAPFALAAFSSDGKRQAIQPVSEVCWMKRPTSCCLIETSAPEQTGTIPQLFCSVCRIKLHQNWQSHANFTSIYIHTLWQSNPALEHAPFIDDTSVNWWIGNHQKII